MKYFVKEWSDDKASIVAEDGYLLQTFKSAKEAVQACQRDCRVNPSHIESHYSYLQSSPLDFESSFV